MHNSTLAPRPTLNSAWYVLRQVQNLFLRRLLIDTDKTNDEFEVINNCISTSGWLKNNFRTRLKM